MEPAGFSLRESERTLPTEVSSGVRGRPLLRIVAKPIIDAGRAGAAIHVVEDASDRLARDVFFGHAGADGASEIVPVEGGSRAVLPSTARPRISSRAR